MITAVVGKNSPIGMWAAVVVFTVLAAGSWLTGMIGPELLELLLAIRH